MRKTISHLADRLGDAMATLFALLALLLIPHAVIRAIIGQALHQWTPITWLAIHTALTIAALATSLALLFVDAGQPDVRLVRIGLAAWGIGGAAAALMQGREDFQQ